MSEDSTTNLMCWSFSNYGDRIKIQKYILKICKLYNKSSVNRRTKVKAIKPINCNRGIHINDENINT